MIEAALSMAKVQFAHNHWANESLLVSLQSMPLEQYESSPCSGNGSIGTTVAHLILVHQSWISWLTGALPLHEAMALTRRTADLNSPAAAHARWEQVNEETSEFIDNLTPEDFVTERPFTIPNGVSTSLPLWEMLLQLTMHGVHTRGQIVSAIRNAGGTPPEVSFLQFCLNKRLEGIADEEDPAIEEEA